tara:strand:+ start:636 stop:743 length:108 start_codon:yes stop_codon:yes gene_type:complete
MMVSVLEESCYSGKNNWARERKVVRTWEREKGKGK